MWPLFYTLAFGLTGAYYAKRMKKNPYIWFAIGCFCKAYALLFIFLIPIISRLSLHLIKRKMFKTMQKPSSTENKETTINVSPYADLTPDPISIQKLWYYVTDAGETMGPMSFQAFYRNWKEGKILKKTYVWNETLTEWTPFQEIFPMK
ncbi:MAG: DUF4339 domain-containing protein [Verrucomicrobia bacterium]|nr:DUF4339 domain-containing protein [Verrucomicrobiota bacterium]